MSMNKKELDVLEKEIRRNVRLETELEQLKAENEKLKAEMERLKACK